MIVILHVYLYVLNLCTIKSAFIRTELSVYNENQLIKTYITLLYFTFILSSIVILSSC
jgi:hypothetical protein